MCLDVSQQPGEVVGDENLVEQVETKPICRSGDIYGWMTNEEYLAYTNKFKDSIKEFAKMHMQYIASIVFDVFAVEDRSIILKSEIRDVLLKTTENVELCSFIIKQGIIMQVTSRICSSKLYNSVMYCASHLYDQETLDAVLLGILDQRPNALVDMLPNMRDVFFISIKVLNVMFFGCIVVVFT